MGNMDYQDIVLPQQNINIALSPLHIFNTDAACPAPTSFNIAGTSQSLSYEAERIDTHVGGRLQVESLQDQLEQSSKQSQGGVRVQVSFGTAWEVSGNYSAAQTSGSSRSVAEQSGLFAGQGGYHIWADQVHLKGGAIASAAPAGHNELTANRLTFENLHNHSDYSAQSAAISGG